MQDNKIKSLKIVANVSTNENTEKTTYTIYHWDRIAFVAVSIGLLFFAVYFFAFNGKKTTKTASEVAQNTPITTPLPLKPILTTPTSNQTENISVTPPNKNKTMVTPENSLTTTSKKPKPAIDNHSDLIVAATVSTAALTSPSKKKSTPQPEPTSLPEKTLNATKHPEGILTKQAPHIDVHSNHIKRATFSHHIVKKEPHNLIKDTVHLNEQGKSYVFFYNEVIGKAGDKLTHTWHLNGKTIAKVRLPIGSDRWRTASSKNLNTTMLGHWKVEVTDKQGILLASGEFDLQK